MSVYYTIEKQGFDEVSWFQIGSLNRDPLILHSFEQAIEHVNTLIPSFDGQKFRILKFTKEILLVETIKSEKQ